LKIIENNCKKRLTGIVKYEIMSMLVGYEEMLQCTKGFTQRY